MSMLNPFQEEPACAGMCPDLSYQQRIIGFCACAGTGWLLSFVGTMVLIGGMTNQNIQTFAALYVVGNVIALAATGFLLGPKSQCIKMWAPTRRYSTAFFLIMLIVVFALAIAKQNIFLILAMLFIEILAGCWYSLSYIPFGRKMVLAAMRSTGVCFPCFFVGDAVNEAYEKQVAASKPSMSESISSTTNKMFGGSTKDSSNSNKSSGMFGSNKV